LDSTNPGDPTLALNEQTRSELAQSGFSLSFWIYLLKDVVHENRRHNAYRTLLQSPGLFSLYLRPYDNSIILMVTDSARDSVVRYKIQTWQEITPLEWNHVMISFDGTTGQTLTRVNGVSDRDIDPITKNLTSKRWDTGLQQAGSAPLSNNDGIIRSLKLFRRHIYAEEPLLMRNKPRDILTPQQRSEYARAILATQEAVEFSFGGGCWVCDLCREGVIKNVHFDCAECSLDVCGNCWKKAAWSVSYDRGCQHVLFYQLKNPRQVVCDVVPRNPSIAINID